MHMEEDALRRTVSKNIASYRKAHKDTQIDLATKLNYSDKSVSKWERGESLPDIYILTQIAELYGVTVSNLIGETEPPKKDNPRLHLYILALSVALICLVATAIFVAFKLVDVDFPAWLLFIYAIPASAICAVVFTSLWWSIPYQTLAISVLDWSVGLSVCLSLSIPKIHLIFAVCGAFQVLVILWELFRWRHSKK